MLTALSPPKGMVEGRQAQGFGGWRQISHLTKKQWWTAGV